MIFSDDTPRIAWSEVRVFENEYGIKGSTTLTLPRSWTPAFALVSIEEAGRISPNNPFAFVLGESQVDRIRALAGQSTNIIVRSSVVGESIWDRGTYRSVNVDCSSDDFVLYLNIAAQCVINSAPEGSVGFLIQRFVEPTNRGEFGNVYRISKTRDHWEVSTVNRDGSTTRQRLNCQRDQAADPETPLKIRPRVTQERLFGEIGAWLNNELLLGKRQRLNCEWVTDNHDIYIVQIDEEDEDIGGVNPFQVRISTATQPDSSGGSFLNRADGAIVQEWDKLEVLNELWEQSATHKPSLFILPLSELPEKNYADGRESLETDFRQLIGAAGIIVRTSVRAGSEKMPNLPRSEGLSPEAAAKWCFATADELSGDYNISNLAFVAHRFVASRASAWARADPNDPIVEIHALWGLPDALQFCPFDIWEVHVPTSVATDYPEYKSDMLMSKPDGSWTYERVKNEMARHNCISSTEAKDLADRSAAIAKQLGRSCHIMWFVGCVDEVGTTFNLPWYWTQAHRTELNHDRTKYQVITISGHNSLRKFKERQATGVRQALALSPSEPNLMRDNDFINDVGTAAKEADIPVILSGSTLAHAYYLLRTRGCAVVTTSVKVHSRIRRRVKLGKLVRDNIPSKIGERQEANSSKIISGNVKKGFLISKLIEEAMEVRSAFDKSQKTEELADLFEVLSALAKADDVSFQSIKEAADLKRRTAGGFDKGLLLLETGIVSSERGRSFDIERVGGEVLLDQTSHDTIEIPFSFFGFMELDHPCSILLEHFGVWLQVSLRADRIEVKLVRGSEQLDLPLN